MSAHILKDLIGFDKYDLAENRKGRMTKHQRDVVIRKSIMQMLIPGLLLLFFGAFFFTEVQQHQSEIASTSIQTRLLFLGAGTLILFLFTGYKLITLMLDIDKGVVAKTEGAMYHSQISTKSSSRPAILINGMRFEVHYSTRGILFDGSQCRVYYAPHTHIIMSMELIKQED